MLCEVGIEVDLKKISNFNTIVGKCFLFSYTELLLYFCLGLFVHTCVDLSGLSFVSLISLFPCASIIIISVALSLEIKSCESSNIVWPSSSFVLLYKF